MKIPFEIYELIMEEMVLINLKRYKEDYDTKVLYNSREFMQKYLKIYRFESVFTLPLLYRTFKNCFATDKVGLTCAPLLKNLCEADLYSWMSTYAGAVRMYTFIDSVSQRELVAKFPQAENVEEWIEIEHTNYNDFLVRMIKTLFGNIVEID